MYLFNNMSLFNNTDLFNKAFLTCTSERSSLVPLSVPL